MKAEQGAVLPYPKNSLDKRQKRIPHSTPHDAILAELHASPDGVASPEPSDVNLLTPPSSLHPYQPSGLPSPDHLLDPFDGTSLGTLVPHSQDEVQPDHHSVPSQINLSAPEIGSSKNANTAVTSSELVWSHLSNILDLQGQISKKHLEMESIGSVDVKGKKHTFSHKSTLSNASVPGSSSGTKRTIPDLTIPPGLITPSTISSSVGEPDGDEENVNVPSEEAERNKAREEEFASLAQQFEGRKQAINDIMGKLDDLFHVLSEFHSLQEPSFVKNTQESTG